MAVRVKTDKDSHLLYCTGTRGKVDSLQLHENASNSESFGHTRQQMSFEEETAQGNESFSQIEPRLTIKQEIDENYNITTSPCSARSPSPRRARRSKSPQDNLSPHEFTERFSPDNMKREYSKDVSRPGNATRSEKYPFSESKSRPEATVVSKTSLHVPGSRLFRPDERMRNLHFEALSNHQGSTVDDLPSASKRVYSHYGSVPTMVSRFSENYVVPQRFRARSNEEFLRHEWRQSSLHEVSHGEPPVYRNGVAEVLNNSEPRSKNNSNGFQEEQDPGVNDSSPNDSKTYQNGFSVTGINSEKGAVHKKDEEPVWKKYQWYRDRKRPHSQQTKQRKLEQTIFMQYNEIRCRRVQEGKVVNAGRKRSSESWFLGDSKEISYQHRSSLKRARSLEYSFGETQSNNAVVGQIRSSPPQTLGGVSADNSEQANKSYVLPRENLAHNVFDKDNLEGFKDAEETHFNTAGNFYCFCGREGCIEQQRSARHVIFCHEGLKARNQECSTKFKEKTGVEIVDREERMSPELGDGSFEGISTQIDNDNTEVLPEKLRRCPQDVAKILRLNRIVKAVTNGRKKDFPLDAKKELQTVLRIKKPEDHHNSIAHEDDHEATWIGRLDKQSENLSDSEQESDQRCDSENSAEKTIEDDDDDEEERNSIGNYKDYFSYPEKKPPQMRNELDNGSVFTQSVSDQEPFLVRKPNSVEHLPTRDDNDAVCQVNGLLSLPGFKETKFNISLGELKRRMNPPETLTRVEMISYVRQAKSSGRVLLDKNNIVTANRSRPTILSRVCEGEAQVLADGIHKMNRDYLPLIALARKTVDTYRDDDCQIENCEDCRLKLRRRIVDVEITRNSLKELHKTIEESRKDDVLQTFELASHTFGVPNVLNHLSLLDDYFKTLLWTLQDD